MNKEILHKEVQDFIHEHLNSDITKLILKGSPFKGITIQELASQIVSKKKCEKKLPTWFQAENIYYPPKLNIEQTSSETTASYKSKLIQGSGILDMTGGFGVDCMAFSKVFDRVIHCEQNIELSEIAHHNFVQLGIHNIDSIDQDAIQYLQNLTHSLDWIYLDPSRRNDHKGKVFLLEDCEPNLPLHLDLLFNSSENILVKVSPILDISSAINELKFVKEVHIVAINNEVKELLFLLKKNYQGDINIKTINIQKEKEQNFEFSLGSIEPTKYSLPLNFLYEPNSAILKSGGFHQISQKLGTPKLHPHSHLYTTENLIDFPGRRFKIEAILPYDKKKIKKILSEQKGNITTRNFPKTVQQIRKDLKIKDGGTDYLFFTRDINEKYICIYCKKA